MPNASYSIYVLCWLFQTSAHYSLWLECSLLLLQLQTSAHQDLAILFSFEPWQYTPRAFSHGSSHLTNTIWERELPTSPWWAFNKQMRGKKSWVPLDCHQQTRRKYHCSTGMMWEATRAAPQLLCGSRPAHGSPVGQSLALVRAVSADWGLRCSTDIKSRRGSFVLGFVWGEYNWSEDGFLYLSRHECRQQLCIPPPGLLHIHRLLVTEPSARKRWRAKADWHMRPIQELGGWSR